MALCLESGLQPEAELIHSIFLLLLSSDVEQSPEHYTLKFMCHYSEVQEYLSLCPCQIPVWVALSASLCFHGLQLCYIKLLGAVCSTFAVMILFHQTKLGSNLQVIWTLQFVFFTLRCSYFSGWKCIDRMELFCSVQQRLRLHLFRYTEKFHWKNIHS